MAIVFPASPSVNETFTAGSITYKWDGDKWIGLGVTPADKLIEGSNSLELDANNDLVYTAPGTLKVNSADASGYIAEFNQTNTSNSGQILINSPTDGESKPTILDLARGGTVKWSLGMGYLDTNNAFHISTSTLQSGFSNSKLIINPDGNTGIGRSPSYSGIFGGSQRTLHIGGSAAPCLRITSDTASQGDLVIHAGNSGGDSVIGSLAEGGDLVFYTRPTGGSITERLRLRDNGCLQFGPLSLTNNEVYFYQEIGGGLIKKYYVVDNLGAGQLTRFTFAGTDRTCCMITINAVGSWTASNTSSNHVAAQFVSRVFTNSSGDSTDNSTVTTPFATTYGTGSYAFNNAGSFGYSIDITNPTGDSGVSFSYEVIIQNGVAGSQHSLISSSTA